MYLKHFKRNKKEKESEKENEKVKRREKEREGGREILTGHLLSALWASVSGSAELCIERRRHMQGKCEIKWRVNGTHIYSKNLNQWNIYLLTFCPTTV